MNKTYKIIFVIALLSIVILVIGSSYAYFKATVTGDSESISIKSGKMELTFNDGTSEVSLPNAKPGDYMVKDFNVENTSTVNSSYDYEYIYNIKLVDVEVTFKEEDLEYTLEEYTDDTYEELKTNGVKESGYINEETITEEKEMYIAARITRPPKGEKHYYRLTITFKNLEEVNQNYNQGATFSAKVNIDDNKRPSFGSNDLELAIYIDGEQSDEPPIKGDNYKFVGMECDNGFPIAEWDEETWNFKQIFDVNVPNKCDVYFSDNIKEFSKGQIGVEYIVSESGYYLIELWGGHGTDAWNGGGNGGYTKGDIYLEKDEVLYFYVGVGGGGGASDVRLNNGAWNDFESLKSRIMVAGGGGSARISNSSGGWGGHGGGLSGTTGGRGDCLPGTQNSGASFGASSGLGGSGWYDGYSNNYGGGGGSSYISGYDGCKAIDSEQSTGFDHIVHKENSLHDSGKVFTNAITRAGNEKMPTYTGISGGVMTGNANTAHAKISFLKKS